MAASVIQRSFAAGELAPALHARADTVKYTQGLKTCRNFFVRREGGVSNRSGFGFVDACKDDTPHKRLMRFVTQNSGVGLLIEIGQGYLRFYKNGAQIQVTGVPAWNALTNYVPGDLVVVAGVNYYAHTASLNQTPPDTGFWQPLTGAIYEIPTPYVATDKFQWHQSGNVLTITHPTYPPMDLIYVTDTRWVLQLVTTLTTMPTPTGLAGTGGTPVPIWDPAAGYGPGVVVSKGGVNYYCIVTNTNHTPPNATYWSPISTAAAAWSAATTYVIGDVVQIGSLKYTCILGHANHPPPNNTYWQILGEDLLPYTYVITAAALDTYEESLPTAPIVMATLAVPTPATPNVLTWDVQPGAAEFYVYCDPYGNGVFGFIGTASSNTFNDTGFVPDFAVTPPIARVLFATPNNYPTTSATFQQRRFFANTNLEPDSVWGSRTGFLSNFGITSPLQDDDAITFRLNGNNNHPIRFMEELNAGLILITDGGEWAVTGGSGPMTAITPASLLAQQQTYVGIAPTIRPVIVGDTILYVQQRGAILRELGFTQTVIGWAPAGKDLTIYAAHLFDRKAMVAIDFQQEPHSIIWGVRNDGILLGLTYIPDQEISGWHRHDTYTNLPGTGAAVQSIFEDVCVVPEAEEDVVYVIVARVIGGTTKRFIERLERRAARDNYFAADSFFVDSGMSYGGVPVTAVTGLDHLDGQVVAVLADGVTVFNGDPTAANAADFTVVAGQIDLPAPASNIHIGLPIRYADIETLDLDTQGTAIRDQKKRVVGVTVLIERSARSFWAGPDTAHLRQYTENAWDSAALSETGPYELQLTSEFTRAGRVLIRQIDPLPITILGVIPSVEMGS